MRTKLLIGIGLVALSVWVWVLPKSQTQYLAVDPDSGIYAYGLNGERIALDQTLVEAVNLRCMSLTGTGVLLLSLEGEVKLAIKVHCPPGSKPL